MLNLWELFPQDITDDEGWWSTPKVFPHGYKQIMFGSMRYQNSWDWLMEVVEKIELLDFVVSIWHENTNIYSGSLNEKKFDIEYVSRTKIEATYLACVEFIKWYNNQNIEVNNASNQKG